MNNQRLTNCPLCGNDEFDGHECTECGLDTSFDPYLKW